MDTERECLRRAWNLVLNQRELLDQIVPTTQELAKFLTQGLTPAPAQAARWAEISRDVAEVMLELEVSFASLQQVIGPFIGYDA